MRTLSHLLFLAVVLALGLASSARADYIEDSRTAKGLTLTIPRTALGECLKAMSEASGVSLAASPALASEQLVGHVPRRPLRETMRALEELFDAVWTTLPGSPASYRLDPDPARAKALAAARAAEIKEYRKAADGPAAEAALRVKKGEPLPSTQQLQWEMLGPLLWSYLPPADRDRVFAGETVTISIPAAQAKAIHELIILIASKARAPLIAPVLATFDLDDKADTGIPNIRARATALRENSVVGAISQIDFIKHGAIPKPTEAPPGDPTLPAMVGDEGRFNGERDELMVKFAVACELPILSRHRVQGGSSRTLVAGGRKLSDVMADLSSTTDARHEVNSRGYHLFRSRTEAIDRAGVPPMAAVNRYLSRRPAAGAVVSYPLLSELAPLTPLQLAVLERSNLATAEAMVARETFALLRFYQSLNPQQREQLFSSEGLPVSTLTHPQLHALLDEKRKRGEFDIHDHVQQIRGLHFRFRQQGDKNDGELVMEAVRDGTVVGQATQDLPRVDREERLKVSP